MYKNVWIETYNSWGNRHEDDIYKTKRKIIDPFERDQVRTIFNTIKMIIEEDAKKSKISFTD